MMKGWFVRTILVSLLLSLVLLSANGNSADDAKTVAALDIDYQAAVRIDNAATMNRILADDFVVVTGSGKVYTKADVLETARTHQVQYEHQEDSNQTVRVWHDTAVVTAELWMKGTNQGRRSTGTSGSVIRTCGLLLDGDTCTARSLCLCRTARIEWAS